MAELLPTTHDGLTTAEVWQLSMDFTANPQVFQCAVRFHGEYVQDIEDCRAQLVDLQQRETAQRNSQLFFSRMEGQIHAIQPPNNLAGTALGAAFGKLSGQRHELLKRKDEVYNYGEEISRDLAAYLRQTVPDISSATFNGTTYEWPMGIMITRTGTEAGHTLLHVFGGSAFFTAVAQKYAVYNAHKIRDRREINPKMVSTQEWLSFLDNLTALTRF